MILEFDNIGSIQKENLIFVMGTFDILHAGHIHFLEQAKTASEGYKLIVGIIPDKIVSERKGAGRPVTSESDRAGIVEALKGVDYVFILPELPLHESAVNVIKRLHPEYSVASREAFENRTEDWDVGGTKLVLLDKIPERSTTNIVSKIRE